MRGETILHGEGSKRLLRREKEREEGTKKEDEDLKKEK